jgi:hypothetical protein
MISMARKLKAYVLIFSILAAPLAAQATSDSKNFMMCRNAKTVRTVRVTDKDGECVTIYTKSGVDKEVGGGKNYQSCLKIIENIRTNLEKAGWKCRDVGQASVTQ